MPTYVTEITLHKGIDDEEAHWTIFRTTRKGRQVWQVCSVDVPTYSFVVDDKQLAQWLADNS